MLVWSIPFLTFAVVLLITVTLAQSINEQISLVSSSLFEMVLHPTFSELDVVATSKVEDEIEISLFSSASTSTKFAVFDIDIVLQQVELDLIDAKTKNAAVPADSTSLRFTALASFLQDVSSNPSQFALDSLIVQTFSQPSAKTSFISMLQSSGDPLLEDVTDISISLINTSTDELNGSGNDTTSLSKLDVICEYDIICLPNRNTCLSLSHCSILLFLFGYSFYSSFPPLSNYSDHCQLVHLFGHRLHDIPASQRSC
jgi:hypothetical protein